MLNYANSDIFKQREKQKKIEAFKKKQQNFVSQQKNGSIEQTIITEGNEYDDNEDISQHNCSVNNNSCYISLKKGARIQKNEHGKQRLVAAPQNFTNVSFYILCDATV